jgi:hypothetical protein
VAVPRREVCEGHFVGTSDLGLDVMDLAREAVRRQPFCHGIGIEKRSIDPLGWCAKYSLKFDGILGHCALSFAVCVAVVCDGQSTTASTMATNGKGSDRHGSVLF